MSTVSWIPYAGGPGAGLFAVITGFELDVQSRPEGVPARGIRPGSWFFIARDLRAPGSDWPRCGYAADCASAQAKVLQAAVDRAHEHAEAEHDEFLLRELAGTPGAAHLRDTLLRAASAVRRSL